MMHYQKTTTTSRGLTPHDLELIQALWNEKEILRAKRDHHRREAAKCTKELRELTSKKLAEKFEVAPSAIEHATQRLIHRNIH